MRICATTLLLCWSSLASASSIFLTNSQNQLLLVNSAAPGSVLSAFAITGLQTGESILGIDFRPATGELYALGSSSRLYTLNTTSGAATAVGAAGAFTLSGTLFGFDFNPTVDRIRVVSDAGQNLRLNPNGSLTATDGPLNGAASGATGAGYTNSFAGTASTTLYVVDAGSDALYIQNPPNAGTLVRVGGLGLDIGGVQGFDIAFPGNTAFAAFSTGGTSGLYTVDLTSGAATLVGTLGSGQTVTGLAVAPVPEPATVFLSGLGLGLVAVMRRRQHSRDA